MFTNALVCIEHFDDHVTHHFAFDRQGNPANDLPNVVFRRSDDLIYRPANQLPTLQSRDSSLIAIQS